ncbi:MAG: hypothetical protein ABF633_16135 [Clostridium sp.]
MKIISKRCHVHFELYEETDDQDNELFEDFANAAGFKIGLSIYLNMP